MSESPASTTPRAEFDLQIVSRDGGLFLESVGDPPIRLTYVGNGTFAQTDSPEMVEVVGHSLKVKYYGATRFEAIRVC